MRFLGTAETPAKTGLNAGQLGRVVLFSEQTSIFGSCSHTYLQHKDKGSHSAVPFWKTRELLRCPRAPILVVLDLLATR